MLFCHEVEYSSAAEEKRRNNKAAHAYEESWKSLHKSRIEIIYQDGNEEAYAKRRQQNRKSSKKFKWLILGVKSEYG